MYLTTFTTLLICLRKSAHGGGCLFAHVRRSLYVQLNGKLEMETHPLFWQAALDGEIPCYFSRFSGGLHDHRALILLSPLHQLS